MIITERAALEGLRLRCLHEQAKGNRRMATTHERTYLVQKATSQASQKSTVDKMIWDMGYLPIFKCLERWLRLDGGLADVEPNLIAGIAIDILNKEEEK